MDGKRLRNHRAAWAEVLNPDADPWAHAFLPYNDEPPRASASGLTAEQRDLSTIALGARIDGVASAKIVSQL